MKTSYKILALAFLCFSCTFVFSQSTKEPEALGLPGDNLNLYAVLDLFQKSKTIEDFEKTLNDANTKINNLDLNNDQKVDFIKVDTKKDGDNFTFILRDPVTKTETQDVAVILISKDKDGKITLQIVGDEALYGKNYIVEPVTETATPNPAYKAHENTAATAPATSTEPAKTETTVVVVETVPVVQYVYSPMYVPYYPPYYYGYYPPYYRPYPPVTFSVYYSNHSAYYHGSPYHNTVVVHNTNNYNNYNNNNRNTSNTVNHYNSNGNYKGTYEGKNFNQPSNLPANSRPSTKPSAGTQPANTPSGRDSAGKPSAATQPANSSSNRESANKPSTGTQPSTSNRDAGSNASSSDRASASPSSSSSSRSGSSGRSGGGRGGRR